MFCPSCLFTGAFCARRKAEINDGCGQFQEESTCPLIKIQPEVLIQIRHNIVMEPVFKNIIYCLANTRNVQREND